MKSCNNSIFLLLLLLTNFRLCETYFSGETSKMYNIHEVITMASFDKPTVRKDEAARFVCQYGAMMEFGEERFHAIILFPNGKRFISDMLQYKPEGIEVECKFRVLFVPMQYRDVLMSKHQLIRAFASVMVSV